MRDLAKLRALRGPERRWLVLALFAMPFVSAGCSILGFRRLHAVMARWPRPRRALVLSEDAAASCAQRAAKVVAIAALRGPVRATCLRRALVLWWLLRRYGIETELKVGVNRDGGTLHAHAWLEHLGKPLNEAEDISLRFPAFERDFGASPARVS
jgi:hypothetical protein